MESYYGDNEEDIGKWEWVFLLIQRDLTRKRNCSFLFCFAEIEEGKETERRLFLSFCLLRRLLEVGLPLSHKKNIEIFYIQSFLFFLFFLFFFIVMRCVSILVFGLNRLVFSTQKKYIYISFILHVSFFFFCVCGVKYLLMFQLDFGLDLFQMHDVSSYLFRM